MPPDPSPAPVPPVTTIADVVAALDEIIEWAGQAPSRLGYFAALYKRITLAVGVAVDDGVFDDGPRMEKLDVAFASRYLDAINGWFHPENYPKPTRSWRTTFQHAEDPDPIIVQHMLSGVTSHIVLDLGIATVQVAGRSGLTAIHRDFDRINAVLASQTNGVVADINELSPALADIYTVLADNQIFVINEAIKALRDSAWRFATILAYEPSFARPLTIRARDVQVAHEAGLVFDPTGLAGALDHAVTRIAERESRDVAHNIAVLDAVAATPAPIQTEL
ncbi:DUF5995 family protein [Gordonia rhizosphera]|uniref:Uncharacterized protein n=1 Tax=Gordonia rhizosphera NBRC 16068 TaxID=1108045 RepID=K6VTM1_9ACTN|nr:DUF5995 family protein [Gordonia rhizosphera]GAB90255.1 hypothetical protein GORHZ_092_00030 [Gordonia rhizosphera NBRC 16068]